MRPPQRQAHSPKPPLRPQVTTLWDYPSQSYGAGTQGNSHYKGVTPSYVIWNLLARYTLPKDLVVDPMAGSGTTLDVARDLGRRALGYDLNVVRPDVFRADARRLPLEDGKADFVFMDPPYSDHVEYSDDPRCIGRLNAADQAYYTAMEQVLDQVSRVLRPDRYIALYVGDSLEKGHAFHPIGVELFLRLRARFTPVDHIAVVRHNKTLEQGNYRAAAEDQNFFLRGFHHLFIMYKPPAGTAAPRALSPADRSKPPPPPRPTRKDNRPRPKGRPR